MSLKVKKKNYNTIGFKSDKPILTEKTEDNKNSFDQIPNNEYENKKWEYYSIIY